MACSLYNNGGYGCGGCTHFVKTNSVTLTDNVLVLNIPQATYSNKEKVCILHCTGNTRSNKCKYCCNNNRGWSNTVCIEDKVRKQCPRRPDKKQKSVPHKCSNRCWNVYCICL